jgi:hypothetical protein
VKVAVELEDIVGKKKEEEEEEGDFSLFVSIASQGVTGASDGAMSQSSLYSKTLLEMMSIFGM